MKRMKYVTALASGLIFGLGLVISGMTQPGKVVGFLDFFGNWDPSLAMVMGGAVVTNLILLKLTVRRDKPLFAGKFRIPTRSDIDWQLIGGGALFGAGWGLAGYCPGPAITSIPTGSATIVVFVASMAGGMYLYKLFDEKVLSSTPEPAAEDGNVAAKSDAVPDRVKVPSKN